MLASKLTFTVTDPRTGETFAAKLARVICDRCKRNVPPGEALCDPANLTFVCIHCEPPRPAPPFRPHHAMREARAEAPDKCLAAEAARRNRRRRVADERARAEARDPRLTSFFDTINQYHRAPTWPRAEEVA